MCRAPREKPINLGAPETGPGTTQAARKYLEGRWSLLSYEVFPPGRPSIQVTGGSGSLSYDSFSNLDIQIRVADKAMAESLERAGIPLQDGVISTTGRTVIDMQARTLRYILEGQPALQLGPPSGPLALIRPRHWELNGNVLTLTTKGDDGKPVSIGAWQKE
jgi:hypothetical protein